MLVIGIDFSIQFPAVCICRNFSEFKWISCVNTSTTKIHQRFLEEVRETYPNLIIEFLEPRKRLPKNQETYSGTERLKLANYSGLVDLLVNLILKEMAGEEAAVVSIEGIAYGAQGNALIDISQSTGMLRKTILDRVLKGRADKLFVFSPGELKNAIGAKGNAGKFEVFNAFLENSLLAENSDLVKCINMHTDKIIKGQVVASPFMDMVDSYLAVLKVYSMLKEPS